MFLYSKDILDEASKSKENNNAHNEGPDGFDIGRCHGWRHHEVQIVQRVINHQISSSTCSTIALCKIIFFREIILGAGQLIRWRRSRKWVEVSRPKQAL